MEEDLSPRSLDSDRGRDADIVDILFCFLERRAFSYPRGGTTARVTRMRLPRAILIYCFAAVYCPIVCREATLLYWDVIEQRGQRTGVPAFSNPLLSETKTVYAHAELLAPFWISPWTPAVEPHAFWRGRSRYTGRGFDKRSIQGRLPDIRVARSNGTKTIATAPRAYAPRVV